MLETKMPIGYSERITQSYTAALTLPLACIRAATNIRVADKMQVYMQDSVQVWHPHSRDKENNNAEGLLTEHLLNWPMWIKPQEWVQSHVHDSSVSLAVISVLSN